MLLPCAWNVAATEAVKCSVRLQFYCLDLQLKTFNLQCQLSLLQVNLVVVVLLKHIKVQIGLRFVPICNIHRLSAVFLMLNFHTVPIVSDVMVLLDGTLEGAICRSQFMDKGLAADESRG